MGRQGTLYAMVAFSLLMYTPMVWIPAASIDSTTKGYSHSPPAPRFAIILVIHRAARWWISSRTLSISPTNTQISLPHKSTDCATALYINPQDRTVAPVLSSTLVTITHNFQNFCMFW